MANDPEQEVLQLRRRVGGIFMPHAAKRREEFRGKGGRFVHYTSAEAGLSIIKSRSIWMRNATCMADYSEVQHGFAKLRSDDMLKGLLRWLDVELAGIGSESAKLFDQWWQDTQLGTYIASISEHDPDEDTHGRLSMWRAFGGQSSARIAFVLDVPENDEVGNLLGLFVSPVAYFKGEQLTAEIATILQGATDNLEFLKSVDRQILLSSMFYMLITGTVCLKHEGFHEEREWRVVFSPKRTPSEMMKPSIEVVGGVPQTVFKIPIGGGPPDALNGIALGNMLKRVIIGPTQFPWAMYEAFVSALTDAGVKGAGEMVVVSGIPIRAGG